MRRPFEQPAAHHARLARRAAAGDRAAFVELCRALYPPVARVVSRRVPARADAEDVVARTFHELLEALPALAAFPITVEPIERTVPGDLGDKVKHLVGLDHLAPDELARLIEAELREADPAATVQVQVEQSDGRREVRVEVKKEVQGGAESPAR